MSLKPEPESIPIFLPKFEQNIPFPLRLVVVEVEIDIVVDLFIFKIFVRVYM